MKEKTIVGIVIILLALLAVVFFFGSRGSSSPAVEEIQISTSTPTGKGAKDISYTIEGQQVTLSGGTAKTPSAPGSAAMVITSIFGDLVLGDVNGDGQNDAALILTQDSGGSGTFFYLAVAYSTTTGIKGTNALLLGDRIAPQTIEIKNGTVIANYAVRNPGEPMSTPPSAGKSLYASLSPQGELIDVSKEKTSDMK